MDFYSYQITVTRAASTDGLGRPDGDSETIYEGPAEVQEEGVQKTGTANRGNEGQVVQVGDAQAWLPDDKPFRLQPSDSVTVTRPDGSTFEATVDSVARLDQSFVLSKDR